MKIEELVKVMKKLRSPEGCPWDRAQTHRSLMPFIMDECGELLDAIDAEDDANFREEGISWLEDNPLPPPSGNSPGTGSYGNYGERSSGFENLKLH